MRHATTRSEPFTLRPGYLILVEYSSSGATLLGPEGKIIDHPELAPDSKAVINAAWHATSMHSAHTPWGYLADEGLLAEVEAALAPCVEAARVFGETAKALGSTRRVTIRHYPVVLSGIDDLFAARVGEIIRDRYAAVRDALHTVSRKDYEFTMDRVRHLERVTEAPYSTRIQAAYEEARKLRPALITAIRDARTSMVVATPKIDALVEALG